MKILNIIIFTALTPQSCWATWITRPVINGHLSSGLLNKSAIENDVLDLESLFKSSWMLSSSSSTSSDCLNLLNAFLALLESLFFRRSAIGVSGKSTNNKPAPKTHVTT